MAYKCKECGCTCKKCLNSDHDVQLHVEIENLKQKLLEKENHIVMMETNFLNEANNFPSGEMNILKEELLTWQDKYKRLYEAHRRVQRVNQGLEDKLLKLVDVCETEKNTLTKDVATLSHNLAEANYTIKKLTEDNERYKNDVSLAIQFLQCKQSNFVAHRFDTLPSEVQAQVAVYMNNKRKPTEEKKILIEPKSIKVPIPTFPPTAMVYSVPKSPKLDRNIEDESPNQEVDIVSAAIMAKVLEERQKERSLVKHCDTCTCAKNLKIIYDVTHHHVGTQTGEYHENLCLKCNAVVVPLNIVAQTAKITNENNRKTSPYPLEISPNIHNIVKVQPNNFMLEKAKENSQVSTNSSPVAKSTVLNLVEESSELLHDDVMEKADHEKQIAKETSKGPRYCSMRVQSGSNNILLDNAQSNIAPVLYTRSHKVKLPASQALRAKLRGNDSVSSHGSKLNSITTENSTQHQQRVADWVESNLENDSISSPDNSRIDDMKNENKERHDKVRYKEMEENVKRFLFGESEFLKTVEIGKLKYKSFRESEKGGPKVSREGSRTSSHTETEI